MKFSENTQGYPGKGGARPGGQEPLGAELKFFEILGKPEKKWGRGVARRHLLPPKVSAP